MLASLVTQLLVICGVAIAVKHVRLPYTIALVSVGLLLGLLRHHLPWATELSLTPDFLFFGLLPPLLFEGSLGLSWTHLREQLRPILWLAVVGLLISTGVTGYLMHHFIGLPWIAALIFGSLISATDPISVLALFRQLRAPRPLATLVEGESLMNDGVAAVVFAVLVELSTGQQPQPSQIIASFLMQSIGGLCVGLMVAWVFGELTSRIDDHLIEITLSMIVAYGSYLLAHHLGLSGVVASISAGVYYGNWVLGRALSPTSQTLLTSFWEFAGFLCNSLVFLLIGSQVDLSLLLSNLPQELLVFLLVLLARLVTVLVLWAAIPGKRDWKLVVFWGGLRGSIAIALALTLKINERDPILLHTFAVVLLSLYIQGFSMQKLLHFLKVTDTQADVLRYEIDLGQLISTESALSALAQAQQQYHLPDSVVEPYRNTLKNRCQAIEHQLEQQCLACPEIRPEQQRDILSLIMHARLGGLRDALGKGMISAQAYEHLCQQAWQDDISDDEIKSQ